MRSKKGRREAASAVAVALFACGAGTLTGCAYTDLCSEVAACAPDPEPPPGLCDGEPARRQRSTNAACSSASEGDDTSPGTKGAPVKTLQHAIGLAAHGRGHGEAADPARVRVRRVVRGGDLAALRVSTSGAAVCVPAAIGPTEGRSTSRAR